MEITIQNFYQKETKFIGQKIKIEDGKIVAIEPFNGKCEIENACPPLFDTHINGGAEFYLTEQVSVEAIHDIAQASLRTGTFYVLPTVITSSLENILKGIDAVKEYQKLYPKSGVVGLHLEGPFLNPKKRGAHLAKYVRMPTDDEINTIIDAGADIIKIWTIAPEQFTDGQIKLIQDAGIEIAAGHSNATYEQAAHAFSLGINKVTHLYNAMSGLHHREPGLVGAALAHSAVWAPIILDEKHCHLGAAQTAYNAKSDRLYLISDALFLERKKLTFQWEEFDAQLINGEYINSSGTLAGAAISMGEAIRTAVEKLEIPIETAIAMASSRPAEAINVHLANGQIGSDAIFTVFDHTFSTFKVLDLR